MITEFKNEFNRIAGLKGATFVSKSVSELQDFAQGFNFDKPLINLIPMETFRSNIGASGQVIYNGTCKIQFITKAIKSDNYQDKNDILIDEMLQLSTKFYRELNKNTNFIFNAPNWDWTNTILRSYLSQYCVGIEATIIFNTACNRV
jgi:hypothetical protein